MALLIREEALKYLEDILNIQASEVPDLSDQSTSADVKISFLEKLIRAFLEHEPFQSLCLMSADVKSRRRPTWEEIKLGLLSGQGGLCYWLNAFMFALLTALGFNASLTFCTFDVGLDSPNNHLIVLVHDIVSPGSLHLVDAGVGYYIPRAISLDFTTYSPVFSDSFMTYRVWKESESRICIQKRVEVEAAAEVSDTSGDQTREATNNENQTREATNNENQTREATNNENQTREATNNENQTREAANNENQTREATELVKLYVFKELYYFNPLVAIKELEAFFPCFDIIFSDITQLSTHSSPRAMCWPNGRYLALVNGKLIQELEEGKLTKTTIIETTSRPNQLSSNQSKNNPSNASEQTESNELQNDAQERNDVNDKVKDKNEAGESDKNTNTSNETVNQGEHSDPKEENQGDNQDSKEDSQGEHPNPIEESQGDHPNLKEESQCEHPDPKQDNQDELRDLEPLIKAYRQYFPRLPPQLVRAALKNWLLTGTMFATPQHLV